MVLKERSVKPYTEVENVTSFDVILREGNVGNLLIEASDNLEPYIETSVQGDKLKIHLKEGFSYNVKQKVTIYVPVNNNLKAIQLVGSGDVILERGLRLNHLKCSLVGSGDIDIDVEANALDLVLSGSGDLNAKGDCPTLNVSLAGSGDIKAQSIKSKNVSANVVGSGDVMVYASEEFKGKVVGSGDIKAQSIKSKNVSANVVGSGDVMVYASEEFKGKVVGSGDILVEGNPKIQDTSVLGTGGIHFK